MTKKNKVCFRCGAGLYLSNCPEGMREHECPDCGQCDCLRNYDTDYEPASDWRFRD
jgi:predicted RNA-binding Zn-ribbon protein involved in translation (DUF1610 family)